MKQFYIIDKIENLKRYASLGPNFQLAIEFLAKADWNAIPFAKTAIDGENSFVTASMTELKPFGSKKPEVHHAYFDIQIPLDGDEVIGLGEFDASASGSFDEAKDIGFYDQGVEPVKIRVGEFAILYPNTCAHAPGCLSAGEAPHAIRKLVVKVRA